MAQRLGRVNRFGTGDARIEVVHYARQEKATTFDDSCERTLALLGELPMREDGRLDASPAPLGWLESLICCIGLFPARSIPEDGPFLPLLPCSRASRTTWTTA
jgi:hypothetical protein